MATQSTARQLARAAWMAPVVAFVFNVFSKNIPNRTMMTIFIVAGVGMLFYVAGAVCGVLALRKKTPGEKSVTIPAIIGLVISLLCILLVCYVFITSYLRASD